MSNVECRLTNCGCRFALLFLVNKIDRSTKSSRQAEYIIQCWTFSVRYITDSLWIGEMNYGGRFSKYTDVPIQDELNRIKAGQTHKVIRDIYNRYQSNPMIKWKNGIKKIVGLPLATTPGLDI